MALEAIFGRTDELSLIATFVEGERTGAHGLLIEGDAGIGKSTVWREAIRIADGRGRVLTSRASEAEARLSFAILGDLLVPALDDEVLARLPNGQRRGLEVALLLADTEQARPDPRAVALAVLGVLRALSDRGPVTIAVDDVQWVDAPSARTLAFALRRLETEPITVVAARRSGAWSREQLDLAKVVLGLERMTLGSLDEASLGRLLRRRLSRELPPPLVKKIHEQTAGNPFFAIEVGRALGGGIASLRPGDPFPVPRELEPILQLRLSALSVDTRGACLLVAASALPSRDVVEAAGGSTAGIQGAIAEGILGVQGARLEFTHPLLASTVYGSSSAEERRGAHARLAEVSSDPEERARHLAKSAPGPREEIASALDGAALHARNRGAPLAAAELFELAATLTPAPSDLIPGRHLRAASNLYDAGDAQGARDMVEGLLLRLDPGPARAAALRVLAFMSWNDVHRVSELTTQALEEVGDEADLRARTLSEMAWAEFEACRPAIAADLARESLTLAESLDDPIPERLALSILSTAEAVLGRPSEELIERGVALEDSKAAGETTWPAITHGRLLLWAGDLGAARNVLEGALAGAIDHGREAATWEIRVHLAEVEHRAGRWDRSARHASDALEIALDTGRESVSGEILAVQAVVAAATGHVEDARRMGLEALSRCERNGDRWYELAARSALGFLELSLGEAAEAYRWLAPVSSTCREMGLSDPGVFPVVPDEVEALVRLGKLEDAELLTDLLEEQDRALDRALATATAGRCRGLIAGARGELEDAVNHLDLALDHHARAEHPLETARTLLVSGQVQRRMKRKRPARDLLERALAKFEELGAPLWAATARAELARIGGRAPSPDGLTATEAEVARLVAGGLTNREVADALFMSPNTVKANLKRIYGKLGVRSRVELAVQLDPLTRDPALDR